MRILQVIRGTNSEGGGPIEGILQQGRALKERGHATEIASLDDPAAKFLSEVGFTVHALGPGRGTYGYSPRLVPWLREHAPRFDAVIVNGLWQYNGLAVRAALAGKSTPYFVFPHGMLDPWFRRQYPLKHLKKWLYWPWADYRVLRDASAVLFTSEQERLEARKSFWLYRANEVVVNYGTAGPPAGLEGPSRTFLARYPELDGTRNVLFLGRIHPKKGCDLLVEAFAAAAPTDPQLRLVMTGPDQVGWRAYLERLANARGIADRVIWTGMLAGDMKWGAYAAAEVFALPSHQENFGISVAEALACGVPVLMSDKVNIHREVDSSGAGLVASDDLEGTELMLKRWLALSAPERRVMSAAARRCFEERFDIRSATESFLAAIVDRNQHVVPR